MSKIEERLDSICSLLKDGASSAAVGVPGATSVSSSHLPFTPVSQEVDIVLNDSPFNQEPSDLNLTTLSIPEIPSASDILFHGLISTTEADRLLQIFRVESQQYALIVLPLWPIQVFYRERPTLLLAILATCARFHLVERHAALELEVRKTVAHKAIVEGLRNIDILQGVIIFVSW